MVGTLKALPTLRTNEIRTYATSGNLIPKRVATSS